MSSPSRRPSTGTAPPARIFSTPPEAFRENFNRRAFPVAHNLAGHPLFDLERLVELSKTLWSTGEGRVIFQGGDTRVDRRWDEAPKKALSVMEAIRRIDESGSWVLLKGVQKDPEYQRILDQTIVELEELTAYPLRREMTWLDAYIFIASPGCVTPYHIDHESNFLLQIHGEKDDNLFDPSDPDALKEEEIECYYAGDLSAAKFREAVQTRAHVFRLAPGVGVHHPVRWPHWVRNGPEYSVSLSVLFFLREYDREAKVYQFNHFLRRFMRPAPPGRSAVKDRLKRLALESFSGRHKPQRKEEVLRSGLERFEKLFGRHGGAAPRT